jgi:mono/diheme cytochrome c family protein
MRSDKKSLTFHSDSKSAGIKSAYQFYRSTFYDKGRTMKIPVIFQAVWLFLIYTVTVSSFASVIDANALYQSYCSVCHGDKGDGQSHAMQGLVPPPRDFTSPQSALELNNLRIESAIRTGISGTAMTGWKTRLSEQQIAALSELIETKFLQSTNVETAPEGSRIYADYCSVCHGDSGQGAVWATSGLSPPPVDFTNQAIQTILSRERMIRSVSYGRAETAMTGWKSRLADKQIETVVDYVINSFMSGSDMSNPALKAVTKMVAATPENTRADMNLELHASLKGDLTRGTTLYMANCSTCHGVEGDGRGPRAYFINPKPRNFLHTASRASYNRPTLFTAIGKGKLRSEMPAWEKVFNDQQIADVSEFIFKSFISP